MFDKLSDLNVSRCNLTIAFVLLRNVTCFLITFFIVWQKNNKCFFFFPLVFYWREHKTLHSHILRCSSHVIISSVQHKCCRVYFNKIIDIYITTHIFKYWNSKRKTQTYTHSTWTPPTIIWTIKDLLLVLFIYVIGNVEPKIWISLKNITHNMHVSVHIYCFT